MKVYVITDLEGVAGVVSRETQCSPAGKYYEAARQLLTAEVNAAVEGMVAEGVDEVLVLDGHGPGAMHFETLHPAAKLLHGRPLASGALRGDIIREYDAGMLVGQHAMAGVMDGGLNHTQNSRAIDYLKLNGREIGEIAQCALNFAALGVPLIFLSGDEAACREAETLQPGITTAAVKRSLSRTCAISLAPETARNRIREGARAALARQRSEPLPPLTWPGPYVLEKRFFYTELADNYDNNPAATRIDSRTVQLRSDNILDIIYA